jgi:hypothetical protein
MLGLTQGLVNTTTKLFSPRDLLSKDAGRSYWFTSQYRTLESDDSHAAHGETLETWHSIVNAGNTTVRKFTDESTSTKEFLKDRGYIYSEDGENSKWTLQDGSGSDSDFSLSGDFYLLFRVKFGTLNTGSDQLWVDKDGASNNFCRIQDEDTVRIKIAGGSNRNFDFDTEHVVDTWYNFEIIRISGSIGVYRDGQLASSGTVSDTGTAVIDRIFAVSDGHLSDFFIRIGMPALTNGQRTKMRNWMDRKGDLTWEAGGLTT